MNHVVPENAADLSEMLLPGAMFAIGLNTGTALLILLTTGLLALIAVVIRAARKRHKPLLEARIGTTDGRNYTVEFIRHHPDAYPVEHIWLSLLLAAKMLFNIGEDPKQAETKSRLLSLIETIANTSLRDTNDLILALGELIIVREGAPDAKARVITARVGFINVAARSVHTSIPFEWFFYQFADSFLAVTHASLPKLDTKHRRLLQGSLARMAELYRRDGWDPASRDALVNVPQIAYNDATVIA